MTKEIDEGTVHLNSITVEVKDDQVMYEMHLPANYYRGGETPPLRRGGMCSPSERGRFWEAWESRRSS